MTAQINMIPDGYNRCGEFGGHWVVYRRMLKSERAIFASYDPAEPHIDKVMQVHLASKIVAIEEYLSPKEYLADLVDFHDIADAITGDGMDAEEEADDFRFTKGALLRIKYPHLMNDPCTECRKHVYFPLTNSYQEDGDRGRIPFEPGVDTLLCHTQRGCPRVKPGMEDGAFWSSRCEQAFLHDLQCRKDQSWPNDPIVMRHRTLLNQAYQKASQHAYE